jgi:hypothetical protein
MKVIIKSNINDIIPDEKEVLKHQGIPAGTEISPVIKSILREAYDIFTSYAEPEAIISDISKEKFDAVFRGAGKNAEDAVLKDIYPQADSLALFALTMGEPVSRRIEYFFETDDYAIASMLDSVASIAADTAAGDLEKYYKNYLVSKKLIDEDSAVLGYSPGYCGWDITGQIKLFRYLKPSQIGITINNSCLMTPIKSVSGVLVAGDKDIHIYPIGYSYCEHCVTQTCQERMYKLQ